MLKECKKIKDYIPVSVEELRLKNVKNALFQNQVVEDFKVENRLSYSKFDKVHFKNCFFNSNVFFFVEFEECIFENCVWDSMELKECFFTSVIFMKISFNSCLIHKSVFKNSLFQNGAFKESDFLKISLKKTVWSTLSTENSYFCNVEFYSFIAKNSELRNFILEKSDFQDCVFKKMRFRNGLFHKLSFQNSNFLMNNDFHRLSVRKCSGLTPGIISEILANKGSVESLFKKIFKNRLVLIGGGTFFILIFFFLAYLLTSSKFLAAKKIVSFSINKIDNPDIWMENFCVAWEFVKHPLSEQTNASLSEIMAIYLQPEWKPSAIFPLECTEWKRDQESVLWITFLNQLFRNNYPLHVYEWALKNSLNIDVSDEYHQLIYKTALDGSMEREKKKIIHERLLFLGINGPAPQYSWELIESFILEYDPDYEFYERLINAVTGRSLVKLQKKLKPLLLSIFKRKFSKSESEKKGYEFLMLHLRNSWA